VGARECGDGDEGVASSATVSFTAGRGGSVFRRAEGHLIAVSFDGSFASKGLFVFRPFSRERCEEAREDRINNVAASATIQLKPRQNKNHNR